MKQKKIENISHEINVEVILKCLWAIRDNDQFYFNSYGKEMIENCIQQKVKKKLSEIKLCEHFSTISDDGKNYECKNVVLLRHSLTAIVFGLGEVADLTALKYQICKTLN